MPVVIFRLGPAVGKTWRSLNKEMLIEGESDDYWGKDGAKRSPHPALQSSATTWGGASFITSVILL